MEGSERNEPSGSIRAAKDPSGGIRVEGSKRRNPSVCTRAEGSEWKDPSGGIRVEGFERWDPSVWVQAEEFKWKDPKGRT